MDDRRVINGVLCKCKTGIAWRDLPGRYGPWRTVYHRFWRWSPDGTLATLATLVSRVRGIAEAIDELDREVSVDSSIVRAHQHAAGARRMHRVRTGGERILRRTTEPGDHAIGRSRGGLTTQIRLACDGHGRPISVVLTGGNVNDCTVFNQVMAGVRFGRTGLGRPSTRPARVIVDKGCNSRAIRAYLRRRHIPATLPERRDQQTNRRRRGRAGGRPAALDRATYRRRNTVERCFQRLKQFHAIATLAL